MKPDSTNTLPDTMKTFCTERVNYVVKNHLLSTRFACKAFKCILLLNLLFCSTSITLFAHRVPKNFNRTPITQDKLQSVGAGTVSNFPPLASFSPVNVLFSPKGSEGIKNQYDMAFTGKIIASSRNVITTAFNDAPILTDIETLALVYNEDQAATAITSTINISDVDNLSLTSAVIQITGNYFNGQDILAFANTGLITGVFDAVTGTLTLNGLATLADYQSALRTVTYQNSNLISPSAAIRTVSFSVNDGTASSIALTRDISINVVNDPPVLSAVEVTNLSYTESQALTAISATINVTDPDHVNLSGGTVQITGNFISTEDVLSFAGATGVAATYDPALGTLTLSGVTTLANYRTALRAVRYQNTNNDNPSNLARTISFTLTDGVNTSNTVTRNITINAVNDVPVLSGIEAGTLSYTEEQTATTLTSSIEIADVDNTTINSATVQITGNYLNGQDVLGFTPVAGITGTFNPTSGLMTLNGVASLADYQNALRSVTYSNTNTGNPSTSIRTVTFRINDGSANSNTRTRTITITPVNDAPVLSAIEGTALAYSESQAATVISATINAADVDNTNLTGATVQITGNYAGAEDILTFTTISGITGSFDAGTGTMTLTGTTTVTNYRNALRTVRYQNTNNNNPSAATRVVTFSVTDGVNPSTAVTRNIAFTAVNDAPVLVSAEPVTLAYTEDQGPLVITSSLTVADVDHLTLSSATVQITGNYSSTQDRLVFADANGITGTFNAGAGLLTLTGSASISDYENALRSVQYENINLVNPSTVIRTVTFRVNDGIANSNTQTRTITITGVNDAPVLAAMESTDLVYSEGTAATAVTTSTTVSDLDNSNLTGATIRITGNYLAAEDLLSFTTVSGITGTWDSSTGTMTLTGTTTVANYQNAIRTVRYRNTNNATPSPLTRIVSYELTDGALASNGVTRNIAVVPVNDVPTAVNDAVTMDEEGVTVIDVLVNDTDLDDAIDITTVTIITDPLNGTAVADAITGRITFTPNVNFSGTNTIRYTVKDQTGGNSNTATVTVTVNNINDTPSFVKGTDVTINEDAGTQTITGWATSIDDGDPFTTQTLTFVLTSDNSGLFSTQPAVSSAGTLTFRSANNTSGVANVTIFLRDNGSSTPPNSNASSTQTFVITVRSVNDAPNAVADFYSTSSNTPVSANLRSNDSDTENNTLTVVTTPVVQPAKGTVVINASGVFTYTPIAGSSGEDTFTYEICDNGTDNGSPAPRCSQAVVTITINPPNDLFNIVGNNSIEVSPQCFILTKALNNQQGAVWRRDPLDLRFSFELNFEVMFSDTSIVRDSGADGIIFTLQRDDTPPPLNVAGSPIDARGAVGEYLGVGGVSPSIGIEVDTYQNGGEPVYDHIAISRDGSVYNIVAAATPAKVDASGTHINIEDGLTHTVRIAWDKPTNTLSVDFDGEQRLTYTEDVTNTIFNGDPTNIYWGFSASTGGQNNYQAVCGIDMMTVNLPPVTADDIGTTNEDSALTGSVLGNDADPEQQILKVTAGTKATLNGTVTINEDGTYTYTPKADYAGTDNFTYQVCDNFGTPGCTTATVNLTVLPVQDAPVAVADSYTVSEDNVLAMAIPGVKSNDFDVDGEVTIATLVQSTTNGNLALNADGSFIYTPNLNFFGTDTFTYTLSDGIATSSTVVVSLTINAVNDAPVSNDDVATTDEDMPVIITVLGNDTDVDNTINTSVITIITPPLHGTTALSSGVIQYSPTLNYNGADSFTYTITDQSGAVSAPATVTLTISPVNDAPVAMDDAESTSEDSPINFMVSSNDTDIDDLVVAETVAIVNPPTHGTLSIDATGSILYTPTADYFGSDSFTYTVRDQAGLISNMATVTLVVTSVNDAPVTVNDQATTRQAPITIPILDNDSDVDNAIDPATLMVLVQPSNGVLTVNSNGVATYTPGAEFLGSDSFTYQVRDTEGLLSNTATVTIQVTPANRPPVAVDDQITFSLFRPLTIDILANDFDPDHDQSELTIVSVSTPQSGSVSLIDGVLQYVPAELTESTAITVTYIITDPEGLTDEATVTFQYVYQPLTISEGFSPNGDSNNDRWYIRSIENFPANSVRIYNRWGLLVFTGNGYDNNAVVWDGQANTGLESGRRVDHGTYYYTVDLGNGAKALSGFVVLIR